MNLVWPDISWLAPEWITTIIAFIAFIVAVLSLWFSSLKGPDIDLCESPKFVMEKIGWENLNYIPDRIRFNPAQLIFINNGTRSGVIKLEIDFEPSEELKPFFDSADCVFKIGEKSSVGNMPHISIRERESCIIEVEIRVDFHDWKEHFSFDPVGKEEIYNILCKADLQNYHSLSNFCSIIKPGMSTGTVFINSIQTMRKNILGTKMSRKNLVRDLPIGLIDQEFIDGFKSCLEKWDDIKPNCILMKLREISNDLPTRILSPLTENLNKLENMPLLEIGDVKTDFWNDWKRRFEGYWNTRALVDFMFGSLGLESKITDFCLKANGFNQELRILKEIGLTESLEGKAKEWNLRKLAEILKEKIRDIISDIEWLQEILRKCIHSIG